MHNPTDQPCHSLISMLSDMQCCHRINCLHCSSARKPFLIDAACRRELQVQCRTDAARSLDVMRAAFAMTFVFLCVVQQRCFFSFLPHGLQASCPNTMDCPLRDALGLLRVLGRYLQGRRWTRTTATASGV